MAAETTRASTRAVPPALTRYRVMATVVGVLLIVLFFVAMPLEYIWDVEGATLVIGTLHGWLYFVFFLSAGDLALRARWTLKGWLLTTLAGTIPVLSFFAERRATAKTRAGVRV
jgi:integral membrane protein